MNRDQFYYYLTYPERLNNQSLTELEELIGEYPYFQAARMLYVKNLKNLDNIGFNKQLRTAAAYINDRQFLFGLLNDIKLTDDGYFEPINILTADTKDEGSHLLDDTGILSLGSDVESHTANSVLPLYDDSYGESMYVKELERFIPVADMDLLLFDYPEEEKEILDFDFDGKLPEIEPTAGEGEPEKTKAAKQSKVSSRDLIDEFIRKNPSMPKPIEQINQEGDVTEESMEENDAFMTETMAQIYLKQGYYYKALRTYEKLSLKYPEKSVYFASQIQKIKELISNK